MVEHFCAFLDDKWHGPGEQVHEIWKEVGVRRFDELLDVEGVVLCGMEGT